MQINCKGDLINLSTPKVMGILNCTPDSFYDGGLNSSEKIILSRVEHMLKNGATFIDVGGYSSRPHAKEVSLEEESQRVFTVVEQISKNFPEAYISIDTFRSKVAARCIDRGACMVNDISGGCLDDKMLPTVASYKVPYIIMHMRGTPQNMHTMTVYDDLLADIGIYFSERIFEATKLGLNDILIDVGFGFSKTLAQNYELFSALDMLNNLVGRPMLVGVSRKSMIQKPLKIKAKDALNGSTVLHTAALMKGAKILRVHNVKEAAETIQLFELFKNFPSF